VIATADDGEVQVEFLLLNDDALETDLNRVAFRLTDVASGDPITDATVTQLPVMPTMNHSCAFTNPGAANTDGLFEASIVFNMGSTMGEGWSNTVTVTPTGGTEHSIVLEPLSVTQVDERRQVLMVSNAERYLVTLNWDAETLASGENAFTLTVHERPGMGPVAWPAVTNMVTTAALAATGGHTSTASVGAHTADGEYTGTVNLDQSGEWNLTVSFERDGTARGELTFTFTL
jgi:hypothetical protein